VSPTHDWGNLFCKDCGAWPDEYAARIRCKGPSWPTPILRRRTDGEQRAWHEGFAFARNHPTAIDLVPPERAQ
jgi:hypothetical protein